MDETYARFLADLEVALPPLIAHRRSMRVIDGMHRLRAAVMRGDEEIDVKFFEGDEKDAFVLAVEANIGHGLPLTMADRMAAAARIITSHPEWSDRAIAASSGIAAKVVAAMRRCSTAEIPQLNTRIGRDGRSRPLDCSHGRRVAGELLRENPRASLREIVRAANISLGTARDVRERMKRGEDPVLPARGNTRTAQRNAGTAQRNTHIERRTAVRNTTERADRNGAARLTADRLAALRGLRNDPSLRFSEDGRLLLRLMDVYAIEGNTWERLADSVPSHCLRAIAEMADGCADVWRTFAEQLKQYQRESA